MSRIRADSIVDKSGSGTPDFPHGFTATSGSISGLLTATSYVMTELQVSGITTVDDSTASTSTTTGALIVSGGVGIAGSVFIGENLSVGGTITYEDVTNIDSVGIVTANTGIHVKAGGLTLVGVTTGLDVSGIATVARLSATDASLSGVTTFAGTIDANSTSDFGNNVTVSSGTLTVSAGNIKVGSGLTVGNSGFSTFSAGVKMNGGNLLQEKVHINSTAWSSDGTINLDYGMVHYNSANLGGTNNELTLTSGVGINTQMAVGDTIAVTGITSVNTANAYVNVLKIDHTAVPVAWIGGSAPTSGGSSGFDTYVFNIIKTASAKYSVIGNHVKTS